MDKVVLAKDSIFTAVNFEEKKSLGQFFAGGRNVTRQLPSRAMTVHPSSSSKVTISSRLYSRSVGSHRVSGF
jgi:hypothetical protein